MSASFLTQSKCGAAVIIDDHFNIWRQAGSTGGFQEGMTKEKDTGDTIPKGFVSILEGDWYNIVSLWYIL